MDNKIHSGWMAWFVRNPVAANLMMAIIIITGALSALNMRTEGFPSSEPRNVTISIDYLGGSPDAVEEGVAIKIEDALNGVQGIKEIESTVTADNAVIVIRSEDGHPVSTLKNDVKTRVDAISTFPAQVENIVISEELEERHIIHAQLYGEVDHATLKKAAQRVKDRLLELQNVNKITVNGAKTYEINVELQEEKLRAFELSFSEVAEAIRNSSLNLSAGTLKAKGRTITLQGRQQRYHGREFEDIIVRSSSLGGDVRLGDISTIRDGYTDQVIVSRFDGHPSINLDVLLIGRASITKASSSIQQAIQEMQKENWFPENIEITTWFDEAESIRDRLGLLVNNALLGMGLVLIILSLFLNLKVAFWVAVGIPVSFAGALFLMGHNFLDYSINNLTTFGFIIVLGVVVDDAIVIGENIYTTVKRNGHGFESVIGGAKEVATPATFGVLTTVAAFYPLTTITGDFGGPFRIIGIVTICCLVFSLVESKLILPAHLSRVDLHSNDFSKKSSIAGKFNFIQEYIDRHMQKFIVNFYKPAITCVVRNKFQSVCVLISILIFSIGLLTSGIVRTVFFPNMDSDVVYAGLTMNPGTPSSEASVIIDEIERGIHSVDQVLSKKSLENTKSVSHYYILSSDDETAKVTVQLMPGSSRSFSSEEFINLWRSQVTVYDNVRQLNFYTDHGEDPDLNIQMTSSDLSVLKNAMRELADKVKTFSGVNDVQTNLDNSSQELTIELKPVASSLGLTYFDVMNQLRNAIFGYEVQRVQREKEEIKVKVRYPVTGRDEISDFEKFRIHTPADGAVPLTDIAVIGRNKAQTQIDRINGDRIFQLEARIDKNHVTSSEIVTELEATFFPTLLAKYPGVAINIAGEAAEKSDATNKLFSGFILGLLLIYALLAIPLRSYVGPFVIMTAIPFGIIGAIIGHLIMGIEVSFLSVFGVLALSGVVVNDSLVLVTKYNKIKHLGKSYENAIVQAGMSRFRAIFLTSITTFAGLFPLILEKSENAQLLIPMAVSLAFGILFSTLITLFAIPVFIGIQIDVSNTIKRFFSKQNLNTI